MTPGPVQLPAGRTGQEYNRRKKRKGAFRQDRYHATAAETGEHLLQCLVYIDLNMKIRHPSERSRCGFSGIRDPRRKNVLISYEKLRELTGSGTFSNFQAAHRKWAGDALTKRGHRRESHRTESIAAGSEQSVGKIHSQPGVSVRGRRIPEAGKAFQLREETESCNALSDAEKCDTGPENACF